MPDRGKEQPQHLVREAPTYETAAQSVLSALDRLDAVVRNERAEASAKLDEARRGAVCPGGA